MGNLVYIKKNDVFTDSMVIAEATGVSHKKLKESIRKHQGEIEDFGKLSAPYEAESTGGRREQFYILNEPQSAFLITLLKNTNKVVDFKKELVRQFYEMRKILAQRQTEVWIDTRSQGKMIRKEETDMIQKLVEYAKEQGSGHSDMLYITYTRLANKMAGIKNRDEADVRRLNLLLMIEDIIKNVIEDGMREGSNYKQIYQDCKAALERFLAAAYLTRKEAAICRS